MKTYESEDEMSNDGDLKFMVLTLRPGDSVNIGNSKIMVRRVRGREVRIVFGAPEEVVVRLVKRVQD